MEQLTERQAAFVHHIVSTGGDGAESARLAGYSARSAREIAWTLHHKPHVQAAIRAELGRTLETRLASKALSVLAEILADPNAPAGARVDAAKTLLDRAGIVAHRAPPTHTVDAPLHEMTLAELEECVRLQKEALLRLTSEAPPLSNVIEVGELKQIPL